MPLTRRLTTFISCTEYCNQIINNSQKALLNQLLERDSHFHSFFPPVTTRPRHWRSMSVRSKGPSSYDRLKGNGMRNEYFFESMLDIWPILNRKPTFLSKMSVLRMQRRCKVDLRVIVFVTADPNPNPFHELGNLIRLPMAFGARNVAEMA